MEDFINGPSFVKSSLLKDHYKIRPTNQPHQYSTNTTLSKKTAAVQHVMQAKSQKNLQKNSIFFHLYFYYLKNGSDTFESGEQTRGLIGTLLPNVSSQTYFQLLSSTNNTVSLSLSLSLPQIRNVLHMTYVCTKYFYYILTNIWELMKE